MAAGEAYFLYVEPAARAPYLRRWALIIALGDHDDLAVVTGLHHCLVRARSLGERELLGDDGTQGAVREPFDEGGGAGAPRQGAGAAWSGAAHQTTPPTAAQLIRP